MTRTPAIEDTDFISRRIAELRAEQDANVAGCSCPRSALGDVHHAINCRHWQPPPEAPPIAFIGVDVGVEPSHSVVVFLDEVTRKIIDVFAIPPGLISPGPHLHDRLTVFARRLAESNQHNSCAGE